MVTCNQVNNNVSNSFLLTYYENATHPMTHVFMSGHEEVENTKVFQLPQGPDLFPKSSNSVL